MREGVQPTNLGKGVGWTMPPPQPPPDASVFTAKSTLPLEAAKELNHTLSTGKCVKVRSRLCIREDPEVPIEITPLPHTSQTSQRTNWHPFSMKRRCWHGRIILSTLWLCRKNVWSMNEKI